MEKNNMKNFYLPLMDNNIDKKDIKALVDFLSQKEIPS